ncbi:leucine zipper domain-containing protein [Streptomyces sp. NPDC046465]|uniref:leucine zipper domain-containing protein n=1 Tax=Streptomyces sp. NPDC046465 TaxID=3155810 RepID=UPI00340BA90C
MTFQSNLSQEKRAELADFVIADTKTVAEVSIEYEVSRKTVNSWVQRRKRQLGIPGSPIGGDRTLSPAALRRVAKEKQGRVAAERRAESYRSELEDAKTRLERLLETVHGMQVTLEYYMGQRPPGGAAA